ncbi:MAG: DMT family transporter [Desulfovibrio sp.]
MEKRTDLSGYAMVLAAATMWGLIGPVSKFVFAENVSPLESAFWRALIGWMFFAIHAIRIKEVKVPLSALPTFSMFGIIGVAVFYGSYQIAVQHVGAGISSVLLYTAPAWVAFMSVIILKEQMTKGKLIALCMTLCGAALVCLGPQLSGASQITLSTIGIVCGLTSGFTYALYYIAGKTFLRSYSTPTVFFYALPIGCLTLFPFIDFAPKSPTAWIAMFILAAVCTYGAYSIYYMGLRKLEATRAAVIATLEPVIAAILAFLWWDEVFVPVSILGSALVLGAVIVTIMDKTPQTESDTPEEIIAQTSPTD